MINIQIEKREKLCRNNREQYVLCVKERVQNEEFYSCLCVLSEKGRAVLIAFENSREGIIIETVPN